MSLFSDIFACLILKLIFFSFNSLEQYTLLNNPLLSVYGCGLMSIKSLIFFLWKIISYKTSGLNGKGIIKLPS